MGALWVAVPPTSSVLPMRHPTGTPSRASPLPSSPPSTRITNRRGIAFRMMIMMMYPHSISFPSYQCPTQSLLHHPTHRPSTISPSHHHRHTMMELFLTPNRMITTNITTAPVLLHLVVVVAFTNFIGAPLPSMHRLWMILIMIMVMEME